MFRNIGSSALGAVSELGAFFLFSLRSFVAFGGQRRRLLKLAGAIHEIGARCLAIVSIVGLFTGLVLGLQLYYTLIIFGSEGVLGTAVSLTLVRELGPVLAALMIVGQAGSALASELGIQRNDEQIDALQTMGIDPGGFLVAPRLLAAMVCFPMLTAVFDLIGIFGGYLSGCVLLNLDPGVYWKGVFQSVQWSDVQGGFVKSLVFGFLTISICAYGGFNAHRNSNLRGVRGVSHSTTRAVVWSSVMVLAADYVITSLLY